MPFDPTQTPLTPIQERVLGTLMEKARTVPDTYPLSLNLVLTGCNQKTSRDPVMEVSVSEAEAALGALRILGLVFEGSGSRVPRFEHNAQRALGVGEQQAVLLGLLLLRGPQTAAELRTGGERWYKFADTGSVELFLTELAAFDESCGLGRNPTAGAPLTVLLPKAPGAREQRWMHLLGGYRAPQAFLGSKSAIVHDPRALFATNFDESDTAQEPSVAQTYAGLLQRITALEAQMADQHAAHARLLAQLKDQLGLDGAA